MLRSFFILFLVFLISGCADYRWEFYSANESTITGFREDVIKDEVKVGLSLKGTETQTHIPLIWRKIISKTPYSLELAVITGKETFGYIIINSAKLVKETGEVVNIIEEKKPLKVSFSDKNYSKFAPGKVRQAYYEFPKKIEIDHLSNRKISIIVDISIVNVNNGSSINKKIKAVFYAILEEGTTFILSSYTN